MVLQSCSQCVPFLVQRVPQAASLDSLSPLLPLSDAGVQALFEGWKDHSLCHPDLGTRPSQGNQEEQPLKKKKKLRITVHKLRDGKEQEITSGLWGLG